MHASYSRNPKTIFISYDYDNDRRYRYLLSALKENSGSEIDFEDRTPEEIQSNDVGRIKAALTRRIRKSDYTLVIIGKHANTYHPRSREIGTRNWQWWEIEQSKKEGNRLIVRGWCPHRSWYAGAGSDEKHFVPRTSLHLH